MFDYSKFEKEVDIVADSYNSRKPYPYAIFDNFFDDSALDSINKEIDECDFELDIRKVKGEQVKIRSNFEDNEALPVVTRQLFELINGGKFLNIISRLTGITGLISDPYHDGGGVNIIRNKGTLAVHVDGTHQRRMSVCRRLNVILFLNDYWDPSWNGFHEQWVYKNTDLSPFDPKQQWHCVRKILPKKNRLYVFTTNDHSWHGHAGELEIPENVERKSLISYYYTATRPASDLVFDSPHGALFINNDVTMSDHAFEKTEVIL